MEYCSPPNPDVLNAIACIGSSLFLLPHNIHTAHVDGCRRACLTYGGVVWAQPAANQNAFPCYYLLVIAKKSVLLCVAFLNPPLPAGCLTTVFPGCFTKAISLDRVQVASQCSCITQTDWPTGSVAAWKCSLFDGSVNGLVQPAHVQQQVLRQFKINLKLTCKIGLHICSLFQLCPITR